MTVLVTNVPVLYLMSLIVDVSELFKYQLHNCNFGNNGENHVDWVSTSEPLKELEI